MELRSLTVATVATGFVAVVLVLPLNSRSDVVKPCGDEVACSVERYKSLFLSLVDLPAPFNGLNSVSVPVLFAVALALGVGVGMAVERLTTTGEGDRS